MTSPLRGKYLVRRPLTNLILRCIDAVLPISRQREIRTPERILLSNIAHLGDLVIATSVLSAIKKSYPKVQIGFLIGSWSQPILQNHPLVDFTHTLDHWKLNRAPTSIWKKIVHYYKTKRKALREIKSLNYDISIDFYYFFPNSIPLLWQADIPIRIGYISGGFGRLLTHSYLWENRKQPVAQYHFDLLSTLSIPRQNPAYPVLYHTQLGFEPTNLAPSELSKSQLCAQVRYIVCYAGPPSSLKAWDPAKWHELIHRLLEKGHSLIFTGKGLEERRHVDTLHPMDPKLVNLCDKLSWQELVSLISKAELLISIDSVATHIASSFRIPTIVLFCGINDSNHWSPPEATILTQKLPCSPCHNKKGCNSMACIRNISVDSVIEKTKNIFESKVY